LLIFKTMPFSFAGQRRLSELNWQKLDGLAPRLLPALSNLSLTADTAAVLRRFLRANQDFTAAQRRICAEAFFGLTVWHHRLIAECPVPSPTTAQLLATLVAGLGGKRQVFDWLQLRPFEPNPLPLNTAAAHGLPAWLWQVIEANLGDDPGPLADAFNHPGPVYFRTNRLRTTPETLRQALDSETISTTTLADTPYALKVTSHQPNIYGSVCYQQGLFEVQDLGSQWLGNLVQATPGQTVLDLCAGAGGKALQLADTGAHVFAADIDTSRLLRLKDRATKARAPVTIVDAAAAGNALYDWVLVDAPCSQSGTLRRSPNLRFQLQQSSLTRHASLQLQLLHQAAQLTRPQGHLVYGTCSFFLEENEHVVDEFLRANRHFAVVPLGQPQNATTPRGFLRTWPHLHHTDAFFGAKLQRLGPGTP
jgi:16S rRNA (cytosine967-C5)-methyltransferase